MLFLVWPRSEEQGFLIGRCLRLGAGPAFNLGLRATMIESVSPPEILVHGLVTPDDVEKLFKMCVFFLGPSCSDAKSGA